MTISERSALARSWLADTTTPEEGPYTAGGDEGANSEADGDSPDDDDDSSAAQQDLLETW